MDNDAYSKIPKWQHREDLWGARVVYFVGGLVVGFWVCYLLMQR